MSSSNWKLKIDDCVGFVSQQHDTQSAVAPVDRMMSKDRAIKNRSFYYFLEYVIVTVLKLKNRIYGI